MIVKNFEMIAFKNFFIEGIYLNIYIYMFDKDEDEELYHDRKFI